jgi:ferredoxin
MAYRVVIDTDECVSAGKCVASLPEFFAFDEHELAMVIDGAVPPDDTTLVRIARTCPSQAISLFDGDEQVEL